MSSLTQTSDLDSIQPALERVARDVETLTVPAPVAYVLARLRDIKQDAARAYDEVERHLLSIAGEKSYEIDGLGVVEIKGSPKRSAWRHDELIPVIVARALDERQKDPETGEILEREAEAVARVMRECIGFGAGKVTGLRARGIQPDEFCTESEMTYSVKLPPRAEQ